MRKETRLPEEAGEDYSLEQILREFSNRSPTPLEEEEPDFETGSTPAAPEPMQEPEPHSPAAPKPSRTDWFLGAELTEEMEQVIAQTVQGVLEEQTPPCPEPPAPQETPADEEPCAGDGEPHPNEPEQEQEPEPEEDPPYQESFFRLRTQCARERRALLGMVSVTALLLLVTLLDGLGCMPYLWTHQPLLQSGGLLGLLLLDGVCAASLLRRSGQQLRRREPGVELMASVTAGITLLDCAMGFVLPERPVGLPMAAPAGLCLLAAAWGHWLLLQARRDSLRPAVACGGRSDMADGAEGRIGRHRGEINGFTQRLLAQDAASYWGTLLFPLILAASLVFAGLSTVRQGDWRLYFWNASVILTAACGLSLPLCYPLSFCRLTKRLRKAGSAVAGYYAMERLGQGRTLLVTDLDLFPAGTMRLVDWKLFGEEQAKAISYAAGLAYALGGSWGELFDELLRAEGGTAAQVERVEYLESGGVRAMVRGETVLLGTAQCMREEGVAFPRKQKYRTVIFLAVDGVLSAMFPVRYSAAEPIAWAMHALKRGHLQPCLAVRDGNITPALLKQKFGTDAGAEYPALPERMRLSQDGTGEPCVLLCREGLMPYAEAVLGARRCRRAVRSSLFLALTGSVLGVLLGFYLTFSEAWMAVQPLNMLLYQFLWILPCILSAGGIDRY